MKFLVLEMRENSGYADTADRYEFPDRYLPRFSDALSGGEAVALVYEPRREGGRQAFVAWTRTTEGPFASPRHGHHIVRFDGGVMSFDKIVPLVVHGTPVEHRLREIPRNRWGAVLQGRAVRSMPEQNALEILALGSASYAETYLIESDAWLVEDAGRVRRLVARLERDALFRDRVLRNYNYRCVVTGLGVGANPASRLHGLLDAAHIQPAAEDGPDRPENGVAMSPTVHRLFDAGLFTLVAHDNTVVVRRSPRLYESLLCSDRGTRILIPDGVPIMLPADVGHGPAREFLEYHQAKVFLRSPP